MEKGKQVSSWQDTTCPQCRSSRPPMGSRNLNLDDLPPGYRFRPTDAELIENYLKLKISNQTLPPNRFQTLDLYAIHPRQLAEMYKLGDEGEIYIITPTTKKYPRGSKLNRKGVGGCWVASGRERSIESDTNIGLPHTIGYKKLHVFYEGSDDDSRGVKTNWMMHEYRLHNGDAPTTVDTNIKWDDVLCKVFYKAGEAKSEEERHDGMAPAVPEERVANADPQPESEADLIKDMFDWYGFAD